ncbi:Uncharacterised protein [Bartonella vinsonii]|uniref:Uncharacterized protein n=1 Tax=Bartonella vinsonii TaxID=33047 RepID=A0A448V3U5_BARVI|nr:Uncharacterised protein [Bartonella vinsonii]
MHKSATAFLTSFDLMRNTELLTKKRRASQKNCKLQKLFHFYCKSPEITL